MAHDEPDGRMTLDNRHNLNRENGAGKSGVRFARAVDYSVALFLTAAAIALHIHFFLSAGGLWRDEITSVKIADADSLSTVVANLYQDSFPILWPLVLRFWQHVGLGASDLGLRALGLLAGLSVLAILWRNAWRFAATAPVLSLALLGFTSAVICYGDSIRAYGLGIFLGLLSTGLIWEMTRPRTARTFLAALVAGLLSVHMLFYNSVVLLAACCAAFAVLLPKKQWRRAGSVLLIGFICGSSMLLYLPPIHRTMHYNMFQTPLNLPTLIYNAWQSLRFLPDGTVAPGAGALWWCAATLIALLLPLLTLCLAKSHPVSHEKRDAMIFCAVNLLTGVLAYGAFLKILSYRLTPWYFLAAMALVAFSLDGLFASVKSPAVRIFVAAYATAFALYTALPVWENTGVRRTNIDLIAAQVQKFAVNEDIILLAPWNVGGPFLRYYHGPAAVTAIPPVPFLDYQRFDQLLPFMTDRNAMNPLIARLSKMLQEGHRIWIVGDNDFPSTPPTNPYFRQSPDPLYGWLTPYYQKTWQDEVFYALQEHSSRIVQLPIPSDRPISHLEMSSLSAAQGWNHVSR